MAPGCVVGDSGRVAFHRLFVLVVLPQNEEDWLFFLSAKASVTMSYNSLLRLLINQLLMRINEKMKNKVPVFHFQTETAGDVKRRHNNVAVS